MAKSKPAVNEVSAAVSSTLDTITISTNIATIRDGGYQQAKVSGVSETVTRGLMRLIPGLGSVDDPFDEEQKTELREGYVLRFSELNPEVTYVAVDNQWVKESDLAKPPAKAERFIASAFTAFSYTQQAFGALKNEEPGKHQILGEIRNKVNKYVSNRVKDLKRDAARIYKADNGITATRESVAFIEWLLTGPKKDPNKSILATIRQRAINASSVGKDDTALPIKVIDDAIAAFKGVITKYQETTK